MPFHVGVPELLIVLLIVLLIFGAGQIPAIGRELGRGIQALRKGFSDQNEQPEPGKHAKE